MTLRVQSTEDLVNAITLLIDKTQMDRGENKNRTDYFLNNMDTTFKMGQVDPGYTTGRPRIIFEGESAPSLKAYPYLASYTPAAGDAVLLARVGNSYIILGKRL